MKVRQGFVSNSSSSSFVISNKKFKTVAQVAKHMIKCRGYDNDQVLCDKIDKKIRNKSLDSNQAMSFSSCNYNTFIAKVEEKFNVDTCNNHDFDLCDEYVSDFDDCVDKVSEDTLLYFVQYDLYGYKTDGWCEEKKHWCDKIRLTSGEIVCPKCYIENEENKKKLAEPIKISREDIRSILDQLNKITESFRKYLR